MVALIALSVVACAGEPVTTSTIPTTTTTTVPENLPELSEQLDTTNEVLDGLSEIVTAFNTLQVLWIHSVDDSGLDDDQFVTFSFETLTSQRDLVRDFQSGVSMLPTAGLREAFEPFADFFQRRFWAFETIVMESVGASIEAYNNAISIYLELADPTTVAEQLGVIFDAGPVAGLISYDSAPGGPGVGVEGKIEGLIGLLAPG